MPTPAPSPLPPLPGRSRMPADRPRNRRPAGCAILLLCLPLLLAAAPDPRATGAGARGNALSVAGATATSSSPRDTDRDGLSDLIEESSGTDAFEADSDRDGIPDGVEDRNLDGIVSQGESDPRVPGLFPGTYPHIPEPMLFDLVRGLGARRGELEVNVLAATNLGRRRGFSLAPEIEWAFADGHAVELEFPIQDTELEALKVALQGTLPETERAFIHGWQFIAEHQLRGLTELTALYLAGLRPWRQVSLFGMLGGRLGISKDGHVEPEFLFNPSVFYDLSERLTFGLENNLRIDRRTGWIGLPQWHWQATRHFRVQAGAGIEVARGRAHPVAVLRVVVE